MATMSFMEAQAYAKKIHPDAKARLDETERTWVVEIPTKFEETYEVTDTWAGTPAEELFKKWAGDCDSLTDWADHASYRYEPLEIIAMRYNLGVEYHRHLDAISDVKLVAAGFPVYNELFVGDDVQNRWTREEFTTIQRIREDSAKEATEAFIGRAEAIDALLYR